MRDKYAIVYTPEALNKLKMIFLYFLFMNGSNDSLLYL